MQAGKWLSSVGDEILCWAEVLCSKSAEVILSLSRHRGNEEGEISHLFTAYLTMHPGDALFGQEYVADKMYGSFDPKDNRSQGYGE